MSANVQAVLILLWIVLGVSFAGLAILWLWIRNEDRAFHKERERIHADRS